MLNRFKVIVVFMLVCVLPLGFYLREQEMSRLWDVNAYEIGKGALPLSGTRLTKQEITEYFPSENFDVWYIESSREVVILLKE